MSLAEFKGIFWWEYFHRLLGRAIGAVFLAPLLWFWWRGRIDARLGWKLAGVFALGGLQGAMGWYMVASGLVDEPRVSHLRLTAHLGLAFLILGAMLWIAFDLVCTRIARRGARAGLARFAGAIAGLVFLQVLAGGLVAGIRAGKAYNTFPLMNGHLVPPETFMLEPWWLNFFNNMATVQLDHRLLAWLLLLLVPWLWWRVRTLGRDRPRPARRAPPARVSGRAVRARRRHAARGGAGGPGRRAPGRRDAGVRGGALHRARPAYAALTPAGFDRGHETRAARGPPFVARSGVTGS